VRDDHQRDGARVAADISWAVAFLILIALIVLFVPGE